MDTDYIFYELFRNHPDWLREFTGLPLPPGCKGSSQVLKQLEIRCDLLLEPIDQHDPWYVIEFQLYHDHSIFNRTELARHLLWKHLNNREDCRKREFQPREVETVILFGSKTELPSTHSRYPLTKILFIDELLEALKQREPDSPLVAALSPLNDSLSQLEKEAGRHYDIIKASPALQKEDREILHEIFLNLLLQRFKTKSREEIRTMIAELTPLKETRVGQEILAEGREEGLEAGMGEVVKRLRKNGQTVEQIAKLTGFSNNEIERFLGKTDSSD